MYVPMLVTLTEETIQTAQSLKQGYRYHKLHKTFFKFYPRLTELVVKYNFGLKIHLRQDIYNNSEYDQEIPQS